MKKDDTVVKHNSLIRSRYDYSLAELRLILGVASMVERDDEDFHPYTVAAKEFSDLVESKHKDEYSRLKVLGERLLSKPLKIPEVGGFLICTWFSSYRYNQGKGTITIRFDPALKPYLIQLKKQFTIISLRYIMKFRSAYSIRLYEIAKSWESAGEFTVSIDELRAMLGLEKKYKLYNDMKRYVIERSKKEINSLSDISIEYKEKKMGRKVTDLVFTVKPNHPKGKNYLASLRSFISYMRAEYVNKVIYNGYILHGSKKEKVTLSVSPDGKLYDQRTVKDYTSDKSQKLWEWLYKQALANKLYILNQTTIDDFETVQTEK